MSSEHTPKKIDAILVAGEGESSYKVYNQHKAFLKIDGKCIINYVLETLQQSESIDKIYVVGSKDSLSKMLEESDIDTQNPKPIYLVEQYANLFENIWNTFLQTIGANENEINLEDSKHKEKAVLIVPCDSPLIAPHEVEYFIEKSDIENYDQVLGLTASETLEPFYPRNGKLGIEMAYLHLKDKKYRINNLHLVKPLKILNRKYIRKMYQYRYQRNIKNVFLFGLSLIGKGHSINLKFYIGLQLASFFSKRNWPWLTKIFRSWTPKLEFEKCISSILKTHFTGLETPHPGPALDIDNDRDYEAMKNRFKEWKEYINKLKLEPATPTKDNPVLTEAGLSTK
jgi:GTP:adenosylcobinamide-phosphate guanylyltransferase